MSRERPYVAVVGSINMDVVVELPRMPASGETVVGRSAALYPGGKGANQAVAAARCGADVVLFGKVGDDPFAPRLLAGLRDSGVAVDCIDVEPGSPSGLASIWVDEAGANAIAIAPGANGFVDSSYIKRHLDRIASADVVLLQLEIPIETVAFMLRELPPSAPRVILDPAPARALSSLPLSRIDVLTPNEHELRIASSCARVEAGAHRLLDRGVANVICTLGPRGAIRFSLQGSAQRFFAPQVRTIDTTAAGDTFNGALAWALHTRPLDEAIPFAIAAGSLSTTARGAQPSIPNREAVEALLSR